MVITVRCISGSFAISDSMRSTASSEASARSGSSHQRTGGAAHAPAPFPAPTKRSGVDGGELALGLLARERRERASSAARARRACGRG